jgi:hypothetical protein
MRWNLLLGRSDQGQRNRDSDSARDNGLGNVFSGMPLISLERLSTQLKFPQPHAAVLGREDRSRLRHFAVPEQA